MKEKGKKEIKKPKKVTPKVIAANPPLTEEQKAKRGKTKS